MPADLQILAPASDLAVPLVDVKRHLRVATDDTADDALLTRMIRAASADASVESGRGFGVATYRLTIDDFPVADDASLWVRPIKLPVLPVVSVSAVRYYDMDGEQQTMDAADYWPGGRTGRIAPVSDYWPDVQTGRPEAVEVDFVAGEPVGDNLPHQAWQAILLILADRYEHRGDGSDRRRPIPEAAVRLLRQLHSGEWV